VICLAAIVIPPEVKVITYNTNGKTGSVKRKT
jgi:hypothetical protein